MPIHHTDKTTQPDEIAVPGFKDTFVFRGPKFLYNKTIGRVFNAQTPDHAVWESRLSPRSPLPLRPTPRAKAAGASSRDRRDIGTHKKFCRAFGWSKKGKHATGILTLHDVAFQMSSIVSPIRVENLWL
jgi:hypothetical protein